MDKLRKVYEVPFTDDTAKEYAEIVLKRKILKEGFVQEYIAKVERRYSLFIDDVIKEQKHRIQELQDFYNKPLAVVFGRKKAKLKAEEEIKHRQLFIDELRCYKN